MFSKKIKVNFFHGDPAGIMFFANIFTFAHSAYEEMLDGAGLERDYFNDEEFAVPIIHSESDFYKPIFPGDEITVEVAASNIKESSFELTYNFRNDAGEVLAVVKTVHVFMSKYSWDKTKMPIEVSELLLKHHVPAAVK